MDSEDAEAALVTRLRDGDRSAGAALFDRHFAAVARFFGSKVADEADQDDLVQTTFAACLDAIDRFRGDAPFRSFLFGIAYNVLRALPIDQQTVVVRVVPGRPFGQGAGTHDARPCDRPRCSVSTEQRDALCCATRDASA